MFTPSGMGYDRAITIFSPEGKIYQVEYAGEAVKRGWSTLGVKCRDAVVLVAEKRKISPLVDPRSIDKIYMIDEHVAVSPSGFLADARILVEYAREVALVHRFLYDEPIDIELLTRRICDLKQQYTQYGGTRPFGAALIIGGVDAHGPRLFQTDPGGVYLGYYATAIGSGALSIIEYLERNYRHDIDVGECILLGIKALSTALDALDVEKLEVGYVDVQKRVFTRLSDEELAKYIEMARG